MGTHPVRATLLMVGITVLLGIWLWVVVSELVPEEDTIDIDGVVIERSENPEYNRYWIVVEDWKEGKSYIIKSKAVWLDYNVGDRFNEEDIPIDIVEEI